ncbi:MAG: hypothetical protein H0X50_10905 [Nitrosopumilus sp.]|nr:hypothetical protein [Nitrosopumilus sp.]
MADKEVKDAYKKEERENRCVLEHKAKWCMQIGNRTDDGAAIYSDIIIYFSMAQEQERITNQRANATSQVTHKKDLLKKVYLCFSYFFVCLMDSRHKHQDKS